MKWKSLVSIAVYRFEVDSGNPRPPKLEPITMIWLQEGWDLGAEFFAAEGLGCPGDPSETPNINFSTKSPKP